jgi:hypothetical protein
MKTLAADLQARLAAEHAQREATGWRLAPVTKQAVEAANDSIAELQA